MLAKACPVRGPRHVPEPFKAEEIGKAPELWNFHLVFTDEMNSRVPPVGRVGGQLNDAHAPLFRSLVERADPSEQPDS